MSFIKNYMTYASEFTDAPTIGHHRIALNLLSTVVNRNVWLCQGHRSIFPNLWMVLVAPSSFYRKSSTLSIAEDILRPVNAGLILPREFSHEKFIDIMAEFKQGVLISYEFRTFMKLLSKDYMSATQSLLTELYDCPEIYDRKLKSGSITIEKPFLNILSASTLDWLVSSIKDEDLAGGFLPRFLIVTVPKKDKVLAFQPPADQAKRLSLIKELTSVAQIKGEMRFNTHAQVFYEDWYRQFENRYSGASSMLSPFYVRLTDYAKKFAMLFALDKRKSLEITEEDVKESCILADTFAREITRLVNDEITFGYKDKQRKKVEDAIKKERFGISRSELLRATRLQVKELDPILATLFESETITKDEKINSDYSGRAAFKSVYFWNRES